MNEYSDSSTFAARKHAGRRDAAAIDIEQAGGLDWLYSTMILGAGALAFVAGERRRRHSPAKQDRQAAMDALFHDDDLLDDLPLPDDDLDDLCETLAARHPVDGVCERRVTDEFWRAEAAEAESTTTCAVLDRPLVKPTMKRVRPCPTRKSVSQTHLSRPSDEAKRSLSRAAARWHWAALLVCLLLGGYFGFRALGEADSRAPAASRAAAGVAAPATAEAPLPSLWTKNIEDVQLGERTAGRNPDRSQVEAGLPNPDPETWRKISLWMIKESGKRLDIELLRPLVWLEAAAGQPGAKVFVNLPEMGASGWATVTSVEPCPPIQPGEGNGVTGRFVHEAGDNLVNVHLEGLDEPVGCTNNHLFWSEDRQEYLQAGRLHPGEQLRSRTCGVVVVVSVTPRPGAERVYNLEVHGEHVYEVSPIGVLVHNQYAVLDANALIRALEHGEEAAVIKALAGRTPIIPRTAAKEFLVKGNVQLLRNFMQRTGGRIGLPGSAADVANLHARAVLMSRGLRNKDAQVAASAMREGAEVITRDKRFLKFLQAIGWPASTF